jgi:hypothetical protein
LFRHLTPSPPLISCSCSVPSRTPSGQLAGALKLSLERGATIAYLYSVGFEEIDVLFAYDLAGLSAASVTGRPRPAATLPAPHPAFRDYVTMHGHTDLRFTPAALPANAETLALVSVSDNPPATAPTALHLGIEKGGLYVLPYHSAGEVRLMLKRLIGSVLEHMEGTLATLPAYFEELHLPGEDDIVERIMEAEGELEDLRGKRAALSHHKLLVSHLQGQALEDVVVE